MITCSSHKGQNFGQRKTFKVLKSSKQACYLSLKNTLEVEREKPTIVHNSMHNTARLTDSEQ